MQKPKVLVEIKLTQIAAGDMPEKTVRVVEVVGGVLTIDKQVQQLTHDFIADLQDLAYRSDEFTWNGVTQDSMRQPLV